MTAAAIQKSRKDAFNKIKETLDKGNPDELFKDNDGSHHSKERVLLLWNGNYKGMWSEFRIDKTDNFYSAYSGYKAIYCAVGLLHEKQIEGFRTIERAFLDMGLKLSKGKARQEFWDNYIIPYNERLKAKLEAKAPQPEHPQ